METNNIGKDDDIEDPPNIVVVDDDVEETKTAPLPEQAPTTEKTKDNNNNMNTKKSRMVIVMTVAALLLLVVAVILIGVLVPKKHNNNNDNDKETTSTAKESISNNQPETVAQQFYETTTGLGNVQVPFYDPAKIGVYDNSTEALKGFHVMAHVLVKNVIYRNLGVPGYENAGYGYGGSYGLAMMDSSFAVVAEGDAVAAAAPSSAAGSPPIGDDVQGWETNNQEDFVDRADIAKSDGTYIYAALQDTIVVLRANQAQNGQKQIVTELKMPEISYQEACSETTKCNDLGECTTCDCQGNCYVSSVSSSATDTAGAASTTSSASARTVIIDPAGWRPKAYIQSMSLGENRLLLIVSGYGYYYTQQAQTTTKQQPSNCINDYLSTQIRLYNTANLETAGELELIGIQDINGNFQEAYMIGNVVHLVTMASLNTNEYLVYPLERYNDKYSGLDDDAYAAAVTADSGSAIKAFSICLLDELSATTNSFPTVAKLAVLADASSQDMILPGGYATTMAQITSLDIVDYSLVPVTAGANTHEESRLQVQQTIQMLDAWPGWSYSAKDMIIIAAQGTLLDPDGGGYKVDATYLFGFLLDNVFATPVTSGKIPGTLVNEFALDYEEGYFRAATTTRIDTYDPAFGTPVEWVAVWEDTSSYTNVESAYNGGGSVDAVVSTAGGGRRRIQSTFNNTLKMISDCGEMNDCTDQAAIDQCQSFFDSGCSQVFYGAASCYLRCWDDYQTQVKDTKCPNPGTPCLEEGDFDSCLSIASDENCGFDVMESCPLQFSFWCKSPSPPSITSACLRLPTTTGCNVDQQEADCSSLEDGGCTDIRIFDDCHLECFTPPDSLTKNYVYALFPNESNELVVTGQTPNIGLDNEQIFAVRFFKRMAYAVTFVQTDPLYVISFDDPATPTVLGEVKVTGFSRYLHSINSDDTMLIGIGRDADSNGVVGGVQISLFDATNAANPSLVTSYIIDDSSSAAEYEEKSFRYVSLNEGDGTGEGILIVPMNQWSDGGTYFDGFKVFSVSYDNAGDSGSIVPLYDISHVDDTSMCYICAYFQERSFVVNGDLITMKGRSVRSHDLSNGALSWMVDFTGDGSSCCEWWY